ncbi:uncharacterized protein [Apostichopus japonicus]|uniref:uncharacterized protein isoform X2 n=1 Tax=Stichopus japonicus TaxID=307972 RepID=UPI003AB609EE
MILLYDLLVIALPLLYVLVEDAIFSIPRLTKWCRWKEQPTAAIELSKPQEGYNEKREEADIHATFLYDEKRKEADIGATFLYNEKREEAVIRAAFLYDEDFAKRPFLEPMRPRYLVKWEELSDITDHGLDLDQNDGWEVNEMFDTNEINFGYKSTFDKTMPEYTTILEREDTTEYKIRWERACRLADEIEAKKRADQAFQASQPKKRKRKPRHSIKREECPY